MKNIIYRILIIVCIVAVIVVTYLIINNFFPYIPPKKVEEKPNMQKKIDVYLDGSVVGKAYLISERYKCFTEGDIVSCTEYSQGVDNTIPHILYTKETFTINKGESLDIIIKDMKLDFEKGKDKNKRAMYDIFCDGEIVKQSGMRPVDVINIDIADLEVGKTYYIKLIFDGNNVVCKYGIVFKII